MINITRMVVLSLEENSDGRAISHFILNRVLLCKSLPKQRRIYEKMSDFSHSSWMIKMSLRATQLPPHDISVFSPCFPIPYFTRYHAYVFSQIYNLYE